MFAALGFRFHVSVDKGQIQPFLIQFPANPRCEEADEPQECRIGSEYLSVDKPGKDGLSSPPRNEGDDRWSALDDLKDIKDQP